VHDHHEEHKMGMSGASGVSQLSENESSFHASNRHAHYDPRIEQKIADLKSNKSVKSNVRSGTSTHS